MGRKKASESADSEETEGEEQTGSVELSTEETPPPSPSPSGPKDRLSAMLASDVFAKIRKKHGDVILMRASDFRVQHRPRISTGIFPLDYALGGGFPVGLVSTVYGQKSSGKTTVLLKTIANAQKMCGECFKYLSGEAWGCRCKVHREMIAAYLDVEGTLDMPWAKDLGVDTSRMIISIPEYAEQTLDIAEVLVREGECDILCLDSLAFLTPQKEIEESNEKGMMGEQSRLIGRGIRKITAAANAVGNEKNRRPSIFFTNQIRMQLGVMFGCFRGDTNVVFADGSQHEIQKVVEQRMVGPVLSWDGANIVERQIVNWFDNGEIEPSTPWLSFTTEGTGGNAPGFTCTPNHTLVSGEGKEVKAGEVKVGDYLLSWYEEYEGPNSSTSTRSTLPVRVIRVAEEPKSERKTKFDLQIEGNSFYIVGGSQGVVVHNSPETQPCGKAPGYAAATETKFTAQKTIMDEVTMKPYLTEIKFRVEKNKTAGAKMEGAFGLHTSNSSTKKKGDIADEDTMLDFGEKTGLIQKSGGYQCNGETFRVKADLEKRLKTDPDFKSQLWRQLMPVLLAS
jgi:RecA/RadA recombinase